MSESTDQQDQPLSKFDLSVNVINTAIEELRARLTGRKISTKAEIEKYKTLFNNAVGKFQYYNISVLYLVALLIETTTNAAAKFIKPAEKQKPMLRGNSASAISETDNSWLIAQTGLALIADQRSTKLAHSTVDLCRLLVASDVTFDTVLGSVTVNEKDIKAVWEAFKKHLTGKSNSEL